MAPERHFLDWSAPLTERVGEWLLSDRTKGTVDLSDALVIVPTRQAGRRLRESLAMRCAEHSTALIPPIVREPLFFLQPTRQGNVAGPLLSNTLWTRVLNEIDPVEYTGLFPVPPPRGEAAWAIHTAEHIQRVRSTLVDGGYLMRDVVRQFGDRLDEPDRWADLARLETEYLNRLEQAGFEDRAANLIRQADAPELPAEARRVIIAAVPDPSLLMTRALAQVPDDIPVAVLIHAPESEADHFDEWGRPRKDAWRERRIEIPQPGRNVHLGANPIDQARVALEAIAEEATRIGPLDLAIGVPDLEVAPYMDTALAEHGLIAFNPAGIPVKQHRLYHALDACRMLFSDPSYRHISRLLRHPDVLRALHDKHGIDPDHLLAKLDTLQNRHLPQTLADLHRLTSSPDTRPSSAEASQGRHTTPDTQYPTPDLQHALSFIDELCRLKDIRAPVRLISAIMEHLYNNQTIDPQAPEGEAFRTVAGRINRLVSETEHPAFPALNLDAAELLEHFLHALDAETWHEERKDAQVDLEGWLELPWNDARLLIVTGMNDGMVPDSRVSDVFLPDALLQTLGLRCDADRLARDAYLMTTLIESRHGNGRVCFIAGAYGRGGDPLRPSRLLFRCADEELPHRAALLFREPDPNVLIHPASVSFKLDPLRNKEIIIPESLSVTAFSSYLACPFRFYLNYILRMEEVNDDKAELDALDFGSLVHYALQGLRDNPTCADESELIALFVGRAESRLRERFGPRPPLPVQIQFASIKERLIAAAREQVQWAQAGWVPTYFEETVTAEIEGMRIKGKVDRADFHRGENRWLIIDYKTSDQRASPKDAHMAGVREGARNYTLLTDEKEKPKQWHNLQLPLYAALFHGIQPDALVDVAYFHLPRAVTDTGLDVWDTLSDEMIQSAWDCAKGIVQDIRDGVFWPPADNVEYDDFEALFPFPAAQSVERPKEFLHKDRRGREVQEEKQ